MASAYLFAMLAITPSESREVALSANPEFEAGPAAGHRARRLIDGGNPGFSDPFLLMAEDWVPRDAFSRHPHRGIETVTLVLDDEVGVRQRPNANAYGCQLVSVKECIDDEALDRPLFFHPVSTKRIQIVGMKTRL